MNIKELQGRISQLQGKLREFKRALELERSMYSATDPSWTWVASIADVHMTCPNKIAHELISAHVLTLRAECKMLAATIGVDHEEPELDGE